MWRIKDIVWLQIGRISVSLNGATPASWFRQTAAAALLRRCDMFHSPQSPSKHTLSLRRSIPPPPFVSIAACSFRPRHRPSMHLGDSRCSGQSLDAAITSVPNVRCPAEVCFCKTTERFDNFTFVWVECLISLFAQHCAYDLVRFTLKKHTVRGSENKLLFGLKYLFWSQWSWTEMVRLTINKRRSGSWKRPQVSLKPSSGWSAVSRLAALLARYRSNVNVIWHVL